MSATDFDYMPHSDKIRANGGMDNSSIRPKEAQRSQSVQPLRNRIKPRLERADAEREAQQNGKVTFKHRKGWNVGGDAMTRETARRISVRHHAEQEQL